MIFVAKHFNAWRVVAGARLPSLRSTTQAHDVRQNLSRKFRNSTGNTSRTHTRHEQVGTHPDGRLHALIVHGMFIDFPRAKGHRGQCAVLSRTCSPIL